MKIPNIDTKSILYNIVALIFLIAYGVDLFYYETEYYYLIIGFGSIAGIIIIMVDKIQEINDFINKDDE